MDLLNKMPNDNIINILNVMYYTDQKSLALTCKKYNDIYLSHVHRILRLQSVTLKRSQVNSIGSITMSLINNNTIMLKASHYDKVMISLYYIFKVNIVNTLIIVPPKSITQWINSLRALQLIDPKPSDSSILIIHKNYSRHKKLVTHNSLFQTHRVLLTTHNTSSKMTDNVDLLIIDGNYNSKLVNVTSKIVFN